MTAGSFTSFIAGTHEEHGLTKLAATMALVSTLVGGAVVSMPHAIFYTGIPLGVFMIAFFAV